MASGDPAEDCLDAGTPDGQRVGKERCGQSCNEKCTGLKFELCPTYVPAAHSMEVAVSQCVAVQGPKSSSQNCFNASNITNIDGGTRDCTAMSISVGSNLFIHGIIAFVTMEHSPPKSQLGLSAFTGAELTHVSLLFHALVCADLRGRKSGPGGVNHGTMMLTHNSRPQSFPGRRRDRSEEARRSGLGEQRRQQVYQIREKVAAAEAPAAVAVVDNSDNEGGRKLSEKQAPQDKKPVASATTTMAIMMMTMIALP